MTTLIRVFGTSGGWKTDHWDGILSRRGREEGKDTFQDHAVLDMLATHLYNTSVYQMLSTIYFVYGATPSLQIPFLLASSNKTGGRLLWGGGAESPNGQYPRDLSLFPRFLGGRPIYDRDRNVSNKQVNHYGHPGGKDC